MIEKILVIEMNKAAFIVAGLFLAIALIVPPYALLTQSDADIDNLVNQAPDLSDETQRQGFIADFDASHQSTFLIVLAVELICVSLSVIFVWIALKY